MEHLLNIKKKWNFKVHSDENPRNTHFEFNCLTNYIYIYTYITLNYIYIYTYITLLLQQKIDSLSFQVVLIRSSSPVPLFRFLWPNISEDNLLTAEMPAFKRKRNHAIFPKCHPIDGWRGKIPSHTEICQPF